MFFILRALAERHKTHIFPFKILNQSVITRFISRQMWNLRILFCVGIRKLRGMCTFFYLTHLFALIRRFCSSFCIRFKTARLFKFFLSSLLVYSKLSCFGFYTHESQCDPMKIDAQSLAFIRIFVCIIHKKWGGVFFGRCAQSSPHPLLRPHTRLFHSFKRFSSGA